MKFLYKNVFWAITILIALSFAFSLVEGLGTSSPALPLNEVAAKINDGSITAITVRENTLSITLKDGTAATAEKENEAGLTQTLANYGVENAALAKVKIAVEGQSGGRFWASVLIPTLLPIIAMVAIFWFIFRQAKGGANQAFSFGKSNIRLFSPSKDSVMFKDVAGLKETKR